ncbi:TPA: hypothetical protein ACSBIR_003772, partial [Shigella sonnei]
KEADYSHRCHYRFFHHPFLLFIPDRCVLCRASPSRLIFVLSMPACALSMHGWAAWVVGLFVLLLNL